MFGCRVCLSCPNPVDHHDNSLLVENPVGDESSAFRIGRRPSVFVSLSNMKHRARIDGIDP